MTDTFDPFTLESTFDPLQSQTPPPPPRRRPAPSPDKPTASPPADIGAGNRLAHLLPPGDQPTANLQQRAPACGKATTETEATTTRLLTLEDDLAILTARLDSLHTSVNERLGDQRDKLVKAVAAMLDERLGPRRLK